MNGKIKKIYLGKYSIIFAHENVYQNNEKSQLDILLRIKIFENNKEIYQYLIETNGIVGDVIQESYLIDKKSLLLCYFDTLFKFSIPDLKLLWKVKVDEACCFGIYQLEEDYLIHGELEISRINRDGEIIWQKTGGDIWTTLEGTKIEINKNFIIATDWDYNKYKFDYNGNLIEEIKNNSKGGIHLYNKINEK